MNIISRYFRFHIGRRSDLSGLPYGFWFMWGPRPQAKWFEPVLCSWKIGFFYYPAAWVMGFDLDRGKTRRVWASKRTANA